MPVQNGSSPGPRRRIIWTIAALVAVAFLMLGAFNAAALPGCESCHHWAGFREGTAASAHSTVDCRACHIPVGSVDRVAFSLRQPFHMFVQIGRASCRERV